MLSRILTFVALISLVSLVAPLGPLSASDEAAASVDCWFHPEDPVSYATCKAYYVERCVLPTLTNPLDPTVCPY